MDKQTVSISTGIIWRTLLIILGVWFFYEIRNVVLLFFMAVVVVSAVQPIVDRLERRKIPRTISTTVLYLIMFIAIGYLVSLIAPVLAQDAKKFSDNIPNYFQNLTNAFKNLNQMAAHYNLETNLQKLIDNTSNQITSWTADLFNNAISFIGGLFKFFVVLSLSFYMLVKKDGIQGFLKSITPQKHQAYVLDLSNRIQYKMGRWLIGQMILILFIFVFDYLALMTLNVPYALTLALFSGMMEIIPYIGPTVALIPATLVALSVSPITAAMVIILYLFIQQMESHILAPLVLKKAVGLNPVVIILALLIGATLAGVVGVILSVPAATAISLFLNDLANNNVPEENNLIKE